MFIQIWVVFNVILSAMLLMCYCYQLFYIVTSLVLKKAKNMDSKIHTCNNYAVLIPARNEAQVISQLIFSINEQSYPKNKITVFVIADNCTDDTAALARSVGAVVWERFDKRHIGKGYALNFLFSKIFESYTQDDFDGFFIFDADNLLDQNYIFEMNKTFNMGYKIVTSYRNSKNYASSWLSAGSSLWFLRESQYMNNARMILGTGCAISGTGFLVSADIIYKNGGWPFLLLTEDIEFSVYNAIAETRIAFCRSAILYDEQPITFRQSWDQRLRWAKGFYQVLNRYGTTLMKTIIKKRSFYAFDMFMIIIPGWTVTSITMSLHTAVIALGFILGFDISTVVVMFLSAILTLYILFFIIGGITVVTEWKMIHCRAFFKIAYLFTFPLFIFTYMPVAVFAMFRRVEWKPIIHTVIKKVDDVCKKN